MRETFTAIVEVTGEIAPGEDGEYSNTALADDIRDMVFDAVRDEAGLNAVITTVTPAPEKPLVWVGTVTTDEQAYGQPAVYVSDTEENLLALVAKQNLVPDDVSRFELSDWFQERHMVFDHNSHYVE